MWMLVLGMLRFRGGVVFLHCAIRPRVVLVVVNLPARVVLLVTNLCSLLRRELATVCRSVVANFAVNIRLSLLESTGLPRSQLPRLCAVRNPRLLMCFARIDVPHRRHRRSSVVFGREVRTIRTRAVLMRILYGRRPHMPLTAG